jgi:hypothetical protein
MLLTVVLRDVPRGADPPNFNQILLFQSIQSRIQLATRLLNDQRATLSFFDQKRQVKTGHNNNLFITYRDLLHKPLILLLKFIKLLIFIFYFNIHFFKVVLTVLVLGPENLGIVLLHSHLHLGLIFCGLVGCEDLADLFERLVVAGHRVDVYVS